MGYDLSFQAGSNDTAMGPNTSPVWISSFSIGNRKVSTYYVGATGKIRHSIGKTSYQDLTACLGHSFRPSLSEAYETAFWLLAFW